MTTQGAMIHFRLDPRSGVPAYRQLVDQVRQAVRLGLLRPGDQLPPVREVVTQIAINPNTVHRAYRDLEAEGLVEGQQGRGTFVLEVPVPATTPERQAELHKRARRLARQGPHGGDGRRRDSRPCRALYAN